jgi:hypothetical protein
MPPLYSYMWVQNGKRVDSSMFSDSIFRVKSKKYFGASLGVQDFRQLKVSMVREFIPPSLHIDRGDTIADLSSDHSKTMARSRYGLVEQDLPLLTEDAIWEYRSYNQEWFNFCGIGSQPPQQPLRIRRQTQLIPYSPTPNPPLEPAAVTDSLRSLIDKTVAGALEMALEKVLPRAIRRLEREICEDFLPAVVESAINTVMATRNPLTSSDGNQEPSTSPDVISISSEVDSISVTSQDNSDDDEGSYDSIYEESDGSDDEVTRDSVKMVTRSRSGCGGRNRRTSGPEERVVEQSQLSKDIGIVSSIIEEFERDLAADSSLPTTPWIRRDVGLDSSLPPTPSPLRESLHARAREGMRRVLNDPNAMEKSPEQLELVSTAIEGKMDGAFVIGTGGGKSMAWDAPALVNYGSAFVVMVPYAPLLEQHLQTSLQRNIVAAKYTVSSNPPDGFQILFIQPETGKTVIFKQ